MLEKNPWVAFVMMVALLILVALACVFPAEVTIEEGLVPSAIDDGYATLNLAKAGCNCETSEADGKFKYTDGQGLDKVHFTGQIDYTLDSGCQIPQTTNLWATGTYEPGQGIFNVGLFGPDNANYDVEKCAGCDHCWRLWLVGGKFDGYQNWACGLENEDALTYLEHPVGSGCEAE